LYNPMIILDDRNHRNKRVMMPYLYAMGIFQYNNVLHSTEREAQHEDKGENNLTQDGEGEKRTTPTSQAHVPVSTNI